MNSMTTFDFVLLGFAAAGWALALHLATKTSKFNPVQEFITMQGVARWAMIRARHFLPTTAEEAEIKAMSEEKFEYIVLQRFRYSEMEAQEEYFRSRFRHKETNTLFITSESESPLPEWKIKYND